MRTEINFSDFTDGKHKDFKKIILRRISQKPSNFSVASRDNFTESLRFELVKQGYKVEILKEEILTKNTGKQENNIFVPDNSLELTKDTIKDIFQTSPEAEILVDGYIYEKDLGNVIDPDFSVGIVLKLYSNDGTLIGEGILASYYSVSDFEMTQLYSRLMAKKLSANIGLKKIKFLPFINK
ncbi:hypothetical protein [Leptospira jelokensis]|uniref:hypothetical protein n=1 Tax=Leptospira jelokensis TaxID=2484931 RepID=UPI001090D8DF|nr:hypothetical protein [Leptospira jelokensis]TGM06665.1 hypothetical protein EHQ79_01550 [Leptospira jelokensis]